jgi:AcrR family transcriptional regulator
MPARGDHSGAAPIRQIVYASRLRSGLDPVELEGIVVHAREANARSRITGLLLAGGGRVLQVVEGETFAAGRLYATIAFDPRNDAVVTLLDRLVPVPSFADWAAQALPDCRTGNAGDAVWWRAATVLDRLPVDIAAALAAGPPAYAVDFESIAARDLRVPPRQPRARETLARLMETALDLLQRGGRPESLNLMAVAEAAGQTVSTAYRYFPDIDALLRLLVQRRQVYASERFVAFLAHRDFQAPRDLAEAAVAFFSDAMLTRQRVPARVFQHLLTHYYQVNPAIAWAVAEAILTAMPPGCCCRAIGPARLSTGFLALGSAARALYLRDPALLRDPAMQRMLVGICLGAWDALVQAPA